MSNAFASGSSDLLAAGGTYTLNSLSEISPTAMQEIVNFFQISIPDTPIHTMLGFSTFQAKSAREPSESLFSRTDYGDPDVSGVPGPEIDGLPDGIYAILYGASMQGGVGGTQQTFANISINGSVPVSEDDSIEAQQQLNTSVAGGALAMLENDGNNSIKLVYRQPHAEIVSCRYRWIVALCIAPIRP